ncbi:MAG TPA: glycine--tRNA ligase [Candidatus Thermoplasmatota archaeon]|nr:glycine--tRNA ligase [Candidatus Thermoplasmatota archaeon]
MADDFHDELMATLKRRGYLQPSYEIYGGVAGFFDYGPLGAALKTNLENLWRRFFVLQEGMAEIQCPTISPEQVFRASGHLEKFADTVIDCPECGAGNRGDHLVRNEWKRILEASIPLVRKHFGEQNVQDLSADVEKFRDLADRDPSPENLRAMLDGSHVVFGHIRRDDKIIGPYIWGAFHGSADGLAGPHGVKITMAGKTVFEERIRCPACNKPLDITKAKIAAFNLMFKTTVGPGSGRAGYLRPETAQGMFMDFLWLYRYFREQMPFGAVQLGKAYRNEISPRQSLLRLREFHQMEAEVFFDPADKTWPRFEALRDKELNLLARDETHPRRMRMAEAVEKGIIANGALGYFLALTAEFLEAAGVGRDPETLRFRQHGKEEKAHYATDTWDAEFLSPRFGWVEIVGIADRTDYDLKAHERVSGQKLRAMRRFAEPREVEVTRYVPNPTKLGPVHKGKAAAIGKALAEMEAPDVAPPSLTVDVDGEAITLTSDFYRVEKRRERVEGEWYVPHVVEPSFGVDRIFYATLESAWNVKEWTTLRLAPAVAPVKCGVFPLMAKEGLDAIAQEIDRELRTNGVASQYDDGGAIGRRYARQDEIGTPFCVTVDFDTKADGTVTLRERDTGAQKRIPRADVLRVLHDLVAGRATFDRVAGTPVA